MTKAELFEDIRALLREAPVATTLEPHRYRDDELVQYVRAALRHLRSIGVPTTTQLDSGVGAELTPQPSEQVGHLIALRVAAQLLNGDMIKKLNDGELGLFFRAGPDIVDTRDAVKAFKGAATGLEQEFSRLLMIVLSGTVDDGGSIFGQPSTSYE